MSSRATSIVKPSIIQRFGVLCISAYQFTRPILDSVQQVVFGYASKCKHSPTCSEYAKEVILKYGTMRGIVLGAQRILSCR